jgi:Uma2 family endonuclease
MSSVLATDIATNRPSQPGEPPWEVALLYPVQGSWTESDYLELGTNRLVEFSDGSIEVLPMPTTLHQRIVRFLFLLFNQFVSARGLGEILFAPLPVRLWPSKFREPDIVYLRPGRGEYRGQPEGADLVVEVISEGEENRRRDIETKRQEYAQARIPEYWIVDPENKQVTVLILEGATYREHGIFAPGQTATSAILPELAISVADLFASVLDEGP